MGTIFIILGVAILVFIFGPVIKEELQYRFDRWGGFKYSLDALPDYPQAQIRYLAPKDVGFGIVIPKINVNASIYPEVDPSNPSEYLPILKKGVAQAKGSAFPDKDGNIFLFAHSSDSFYNVGQYNAIFFLIGKLDKGDEISLFYKKERYKYEVVEKAIVTPEGLSAYVQEHTGGKTLTLQTCYPPGTTLKRLIVIAKKLES